MIDKNVIDTDGKTLAENLTGLLSNICIGFTISMAVVLAVGSCFADGATRQLIRYCWVLLAVCAAGPVLQFVFFTPTLIRQMTYTRRLTLFGICLYALLGALAVALGWFPAANPGAWATYTVCYLAILAALALMFNVRLRRETRELNEGLAEYRKGAERR